jgi:hypothetical protein
VNALFDAAGRGELDGMGLRVALGQGANPVYHVGDEFRVGFSTAEDGSCLLFHRDASGAVSLQYPGAGESASVTANDKWVSAAFRVKPPLGKESFLVVCMPRYQPSSRGLASILKEPKSEWRRSLSAARADFEIQR